jgi:hypothetical protein
MHIWWAPACAILIGITCSPRTFAIATQRSDTSVARQKYVLQIITLAQSALRGNRKPSSIVVELKEINLRLKTKNLFCYIGFCPLAPRDKIRCGLL